MTLFFLALGWLAGIAFARELGIPWWGWAILSGFTIPPLIVTRHRPNWRTLFSLLLLVGLGAIRFSLTESRLDEHDLAYYNDQGFVTIRGMIADMPDARDTHVNLEIKTDQIIIEDEPVSVKGRALVQAPPDTYQFGEIVAVSGQLRTPPEFDDFSYREYLAREGILSYMQYVYVEPTGVFSGSPVKAVMVRFRQRAHDIIRRLLPDPQASLLAGILLGIESGISPDVREAFNAVSATHVIAISGSNLVILAGLISAMASRVIKNPRWVAALTIGGVIGYSIFVGGDSAVVRAAIMTTLALVATQLGRQTYGPASLGFAALLMSAINPLVLWDVGFQLSFAATLGLVLYVDPLQKALSAGLEKLFSKDTALLILGLLSDAMIVTVAAQITTFPIMLYAFERFSVVSLPVNLLIVPAQTPLMVLGGLAVLCALVFWPLGQVLAWGSWLFLTWTIRVVEAFARLSFASAEVTNVSPAAIWAIYIIMLGGTFYAMQTPEKREQQGNWLREALSVKLVGFTGILAAAVILAASWSLPDGKLHVTFIDVGDGTATLVETPSGRQILVDGGGSGRKLSTGLGNALPFWDHRLDLLVITEPTAYHISGLPTALARYQFDAVMANGMLPDDAAFQTVMQSLNDSETPIVTALTGTAVQVDDGIALTVLSAPPGETGSPLVLLLTYDQMSVLLAGGVDEATMGQLLIDQAIPNAPILLAPDRGSREANSDELLAAAMPQAVIISVDVGNRSGLPDPEMLELMAGRSIAVYRTDQDGSLRLTSDGQSFQINSTR